MKTSSPTDRAMTAWGMSLRFSFALLAALCGLALLASSVHHLVVLLLGASALLTFAVWSGRRRVLSHARAGRTAGPVTLSTLRH